MARWVSKHNKSRRASKDSPARKCGVEEVKSVLKNDAIPNRAESPVRNPLFSDAARTKTERMTQI